MVVQPRLVGVLLRGRSAWKALAETDYFVLQHHPRQETNPFRIITRGFPHYRVAEGSSETLLHVELEYLSQMARESIDGKITSKKISNWLKSTFSHNSILAISPPEHGLIQESHLPDLHDHDPLELHHEGDGYISDSSYVSSGEMTDRYSSGKKTKRPLRRAISLEDITTATAIHRQLRSSGLLEPSSPPSLSLQESSSARRVPPSLLNPIDRPSSSASVPIRSTTVMLTPEYELTFVPLKDRPTSALALNIEHESFRDHGSLPTPDVSPEELSDSSYDLAEFQDEALDSKSMLTMDGLRSSPARRSTFPGAESSTLTGGDDTRTLGGTSLSGDRSTGTLNWLTDSPFLDSLVSWIEGLEPSSQQPKNQEKEKPNPWLDIPFQFIALLTYPEPDLKTGKLSLAMVRETAFVRQRRKTLLMLTAYTLVVRYCSFDFFLVVLFASNCGMLFLMKNSGRMNVNMAKRAVRQRVGWAKQWAGSIFRKGGPPNVNNLPHKSSPVSSSASQHHLAIHTAPSKAESIMTLPASNLAGDTSGAISSETSPQIKRRGLFGKRVTIGSNSQHQQGNTISSVPTTMNSTHGEAASVITGITSTQKRRFFRRGNNNSAGSSSTLPVMTPSAPVPIPPRISQSSSNTTTSSMFATAAPNSTSPRLTMNTPLSTSPLVQPQSLPQLQFSPLRPFSPTTPQLGSDLDPVESRRTRSKEGTPPLPQTLFSCSTPTRTSSPSPLQFQQNQQLRRRPDDAKDGLAIVSPAPIPVPLSGTNSPLMFSGLSQLLGRSSPSPTSATSPSAIATTPLGSSATEWSNPKEVQHGCSVSSIATAKDPHGRELFGDGQETSGEEGVRRASVDRVYSYSRFSPQTGSFSSEGIVVNKSKTNEPAHEDGDHGADTISLEAVTSAAANAMGSI